MTGRRRGRGDPLPANQQPLYGHLVPVRITPPPPPPRGRGRGLGPNQRTLETFWVQGPITSAPAPAPPAPPLVPSNQVRTLPDSDLDDDDFPELNDEELVKLTERAEKEKVSQQNVPQQDIPQQDVPQDTIAPEPLQSITDNIHKFDAEKLHTWVYPKNCPPHKYQIDMIQKGLFQNTLIVLPTGLGKTFIAAVIMFNYWRWFPKSKVIFLASAPPLITQQYDACSKVSGLPRENMIKLTSQMSISKRAKCWETKRVFFLSPQIMLNDLIARSFPMEKVVCLVVDEAHNAIGKYALVEVVRLLSKNHTHFRIQALAATPGSDLGSLQEVVDNLHINNIQIRTEDSINIQEYTHSKQIQRIVAKLSSTQNEILPLAINTFQSKCFQPLLKELVESKALGTDDPIKNTTYSLMMSQRRFQYSTPNISDYVPNQIISKFLTCVALSQAKDILYSRGVVHFVDSIEGIIKQAQKNVKKGKEDTTSDKTIIEHPELKSLITELKQEMNIPGFIGHPKMQNLVTILLDHFAKSDQNSKVMIVSSFRDSVKEICRVLQAHDPIIRCSEVVGKVRRKTGTKGLNQTKQQEIKTRFKNDELNTLVCTSTSEEDLDIGEVDLIVCYDSQVSPTHMLQCMGRTARTHNGRCILLLTEVEDKKYSDAKETYARVQQSIIDGSTIQYHSIIPSVIPQNCEPTMQTICDDIKGKGKSADHSLHAIPEQSLFNDDLGDMDKGSEEHYFEGGPNFEESKKRVENDKLGDDDEIPFQFFNDFLENKGDGMDEGDVDGMFSLLQAQHQEGVAKSDDDDDEIPFQFFNDFFENKGEGMDEGDVDEMFSLLQAQHQEGVTKSDDDDDDDDFI